MTVFNKTLFLGSLMFLFSGTLLATNCPSVGGYTVSSHNADNTRCIYRSNVKVKLGLANQRIQRPNCPRFILTDPHFALVSCSHSLALSRCVCTIVSH